MNEEPQSGIFLNGAEIRILRALSHGPLTWSSVAARDIYTDSLSSLYKKGFVTDVAEADLITITLSGWAALDEIDSAGLV